MVKIRQGTFETNSSSTHSIVICNQEEYDKLQNNELFVKYSGGIVEREKVVDGLYYLHENVNTDDFLEDLSSAIKRDVTEINKEIVMSFDNAEFITFLTMVDSWYGCDYKTLEYWLDDEYLESEQHSREFDDGTTIYTFCKYGYDG